MHGIDGRPLPCWISKAMPRLKESIRSTKAGQATKKYYVETATNEKLLLRIADISQYDKKKKEFEVMKRLAASGVPVSQPVEFGICDNGQRVYSLFTWCDGEEAEIVLPKLPETMQYVLGVTAGQILRKIHEILPKWSKNRGIPSLTEK